MFFGILNSLLSSLSQIFWKKSIVFEKNVSSILVYFLWTITYVFISFFVFLKYGLGYLTFNIIFLCLVVICLGIIQNGLNQYVYKNEKISVLTPYSNLNKVLIIIFSYLFLNDNISLISFIITIITSFVIILSAIDFKNLSMSKPIQIFIISQFIATVKVLIMGYVLLNLNSINYFIVDNFLAIGLSLILIIYLKEIKNIVKLSKEFYKNALLSSILGAVAYLISLFIISKFGLVISMLFSFVYIAFSLTFSYIFFRDKPGKKDIILSIVVMILVGLGVYFK